jgi:hypothetical protein
MERSPNLHQKTSRVIVDHPAVVLMACLKVTKQLAAQRLVDI